MIASFISSKLFKSNDICDTHYLWLLLSIAIILIFTGLGLRDPWPADEPRFAHIAKEMVETGQWFFPARAQEFYPDKPPIFMWSIALCYLVTGSFNIAFLLPSALCGLLTVFLVFDLGRKLWSSQVGFIAGLLLTFSLQFMLQAKSAQIDAMVCCWITIGCYGLLRFMLFDGKWRWYYLACFFMGIGVITKGVGFLPILMLLPYLLYRKLSNPEELLIPQQESALKWWLGPLVMLFAIGLWFVPMLWLVEISNDPLLMQYRDNILFKQTVTRYADSWHHIKPFWYYLTSVIPVFWLPLVLAFPWLIPQWSKAVKQLDGKILLPLGWICLLLLFFSISPGKRGVYILPALPMLALISAPYFHQLVKTKTLNWLVWGTVTLLGGLLLLIGIFGIAGLEFATKLENKFNIAPWGFFITLGVCGLLAALVQVKKQPWFSWPVFIISLWLLYSTWGYTLLEEVKTPKNIYQAMQQHVDSNTEVGLVNFKEQFILFSPYPITHFGYHTNTSEQLRAAYRWLKQSENHVILIDEALVKNTCFDKQQAIPLGTAHRDNWLLLKQNALLVQCQAPDENTREFHYAPPAN